MGFRRHCQEALEETEDGDFTRGALQKTGLAREGIEIKVLKFGEDGRDLLLEGIEERGRVSHGKIGVGVFGFYIV